MRKRKYSTVSEDSSDQTFCHEPLSDARSHIRLLTFDNSSEDQNVTCSLTIWELSTAPSYTALSYTWGDRSVLSPEIKINGLVFATQPNCHAALLQMRAYQGQSHYWIDSICINQRDLVEKSQQVQMMDVIYKGAEQVFVSLGAHENDSECLVEAIRVVSSTCGNVIPDDSGSEKYDDGVTWLEDQPREYQERLWWAYDHFNRRSYWQRVWIVQELFLARRALVSIGNDTFEWSALVIFFVAENRSLYAEWHETGGVDLDDSDATDETTSAADDTIENASDVEELNEDLQDVSCSTGSNVSDAADEAEEERASQASSQDDTSSSEEEAWPVVPEELAARPMGDVVTFVSPEAGLDITPNFNNVLLKLLSSKCFEPRDHVYGFLGIINWEDQPPIQADYEKPIIELAIECVKYLRPDLWFQMQSLLGALAILPSHPEMSALVEHRRSDRVDAGLKSQGHASSSWGLPGLLDRPQTSCHIRCVNYGFLHRSEAGQLTTTWSKDRVPSEMQADGGPTWQEFMEIVPGLDAQTQILPALQKLYVNGDLIGLLCSQAQSGDVMIPVNMRDGPYVCLILRQHMDDIFTFVGQALLNPEWHPCRGAGQCLHCSGQVAEDIGERDVRTLDLYIGEEDFVVLVGQDSTERGRVEVSAKVRSQRLETAVTMNDQASYAVRRPGGEDADVCALFGV